MADSKSHKRQLKAESPSHDRRTPKLVRSSERKQMGIENYYQRTFRELADIKEALDRVMAVAIADRDGTIIHVNDKFCELYQYSREELIGKNHRMLKSGFHSEEFYENLWKTISSGHVFSGEVKNRAKDGTPRWAYMVIVPFLDEYGHPYQYVSFRTDITPIKDAENEKIMRLKAESSAISAEAAVQARDRFVSIAAHELKTPITSIQLVIDLLLKKVQGVHTSEEMTIIRHLLDTASFQAKRLNTIINDLLDVSHISSGRLRLKVESVNLSELVKNLITQSKPDLDAAGCEIKLEIQEPIYAVADKARIEQVIVNLLSNAMKYGQGKPIHISLSLDGKNAQIKVKDHGIGITDAFLKKIFHRFERADTANQFKGVGLGLWITQQIIEAHHGSIRIESEVGHGSTFIVDLPIAPSSHES